MNEVLCIQQNKMLFNSFKTFIEGFHRGFHTDCYINNLISLNFINSVELIQKLIKLIESLFMRSVMSILINRWNSKFIELLQTIFVSLHNFINIKVICVQSWLIVCRRPIPFESAHIPHAFKVSCACNRISHHRLILSSESSSERTTSFIIIQREIREITSKVKPFLLIIRLKCSHVLLLLFKCARISKHSSCSCAKRLIPVSFAHRRTRPSSTRWLQCIRVLHRIIRRVLLMSFRVWILRLLIITVLEFIIESSTTELLLFIPVPLH